MTAYTFLPAVGHATRCDLCGIREHRPAPARYVWHHILPQVCGGQTTPENLAMGCDNGHYSVHDIMWRMANDPGSLKDRKHTRGQKAVAKRGYQACVTAGTVEKIPREA